MRGLPSTIFAVLLLSPAVALAGGILIPGSGPIATSRAGAAIVSIDDASALSVNPGRLGAHGSGTTVHVGAAFMDYRLAFTRRGAYEDVAGRDDPWEGQPYPTVEDDSKPPIGVGPFQALPVIAVASDLGGVLDGRLIVAAGVFAPNSYPTRSMDADYILEQQGVAPPPNRYDVVEQEAAIVLPSIAAAFRLNEQLTVGARFSAGFGSVNARQYTWGLDNYEEWVGRDGMFTIDVKDNFIPAWGLGAHYAVTDAIEIAAVFSSSYEVDAEGSGSSEVGSGTSPLPGVPITVVPNNEDPLCAFGGTTEALKACLTVPLPWTATLGTRYVFRDLEGQQLADVELDVSLEGWSGASDYDVIVDGVAAIAPGPPPIGLDLQPTKIRHNLEDTISVRLGGSWQTPAGPGRAIVRGGLAYDTAAAKEGWERLDLDGAARTTIALGASYRLAKVQIDVGGGIVHEGTRTQGIGCNPAPDEGCTPGSSPLPIDQRTGPDPIQPTSDPAGQKQSPFNEGTLESGYTLLMLGVSTWF